MYYVKDTPQATVTISHYGHVYKRFHGYMAQERFENEIRALQLLEQNNCSFVPRLLEVNREALQIVTTHCGTQVEKISNEKLSLLFRELENFGVHHGDAHPRNVTYDDRIGRFCLIDFEFSTVISSGVGLHYDGRRIVLN